MEEISSDTLGLHYTIAYPEKIGIHKTEATLPIYQKENALESYKNIKDYCSMLETFKPQDLTTD